MPDQGINNKLFLGGTRSLMEAINPDDIWERAYLPYENEPLRYHGTTPTHHQDGLPEARILIAASRV